LFVEFKLLLHIYGEISECVARTLCKSIVKERLIRLSWECVTGNFWRQSSLCSSVTYTREDYAAHWDSIDWQVIWCRRSAGLQQIARSAVYFSANCI